MHSPTTFRLRLLPLAWALAGVFAASHASAQSLQDLYTAARGYDASYQSAKSLYEANLAKAEQARALLLPSANFALGASRSNQEILPNPDRSFGAQTATISASQPLYRPANKASYDQGMKSVEAAKAQLLASEQDLIVRVSQAYFDVLASTDSLTFVKAQKAAVAEQLASAKRNFEVGTSTITDTREAQARFDLVVAQELAAENDLRVKSIALNQLVGVSNASPKPLAAPIVLAPVEPADPEAWVQQSEDQHPALAQLKVALEVAKLETAKAEAGHKPTLDLTGSYSAVNNNGTSTAVADSRVNVATIGVSFNLPASPVLRLRTASRKPWRWKRKPAPIWKLAAAPSRRPPAPPTSACKAAKPRSRPMRPPKPPARARWTPTSWVTKSVCASTSMCSIARASSTAPRPPWPKRVTTCWWVD